MQTQLARLLKLRQLMAGHEIMAGALLVLMLFAALAESFGLSLVLPLLSGLVGLESGDGPIVRYADRLLAYIPDAGRVEGLLLFLVIAFLLKSILLIATTALTAWFTYTLREDWSGRVFGQYLAAELGYLSEQQHGTLVHNAAQEPYRAGNAITRMIAFGNRFILAIALFVVLLLAHWQATLVISFVGLLLYLAVRSGTFRYALKLGKWRQKLLQQITAIVAEGISGVRQIKLFEAYSAWRSALATKLHAATRVEVGVQVLGQVPHELSEFVVVLMLAAGIVAVHGFLDVDPVAVLPVLGLFAVIAQRLISTIGFLISQRIKIAANLPALYLVHDLIAAAPISEDLQRGKRFPGLTGDIEFKDVHFAYGGDEPVLDGLDLVIAQGKTTALVGPSGIGKSTIADLILGLYRPQAGNILLAGTPIQEFNLTSLRRRIGYVSQEPEIFNTSVRDNIRMARTEATDDEVVAAAKIARADEFVSSARDGYDSIVGDRGVKLSGGQRQRLAIARVVLRQPDLYIFDEATSALDGKSEQLVREAIESISRDATVLIIAHRLSTIENVDFIYEIASDGRARLVEYADLVNESELASIRR